MIVPKHYNGEGPVHRVHIEQLEEKKIKTNKSK
jgi:hypothetical protein